VIGFEVVLADRGSRQLKGVTGEWQLFEVVQS
jgi:hypothetical protein